MKWQKSLVMEWSCWRYKYNVPASINRVGSLLCAFFSKTEVTNYSEAKKSNTEAYAEYLNSMLKKGIYLAPSQFEAMFVNSEHTDEDIKHTLKAMEQTFMELYK